MRNDGDSVREDVKRERARARRERETREKGDGGAESEKVSGWAWGESGI